MLTCYNRKKIANNENNEFVTNYELYDTSNRISGLDWNYKIATYLDRDLHEKLLDVSQEEMTPIIGTVTQVLSLIRSGYFYTATLILAALDVSSSEKLTELKSWLVTSLTEADDT